MFYLHFVCTDNNSDSTPFDPNWPGLDMNLLRDIFNSHKVFIFGSFNCSRYTLKQFQGDIQKAENKIFGGAICSPHTDYSGANRTFLFPVQTVLFEISATFCCDLIQNQRVPPLKSEKWVVLIFHSWLNRTCGLLRKSLYYGKERHWGRPNIWWFNKEQCRTVSVVVDSGRFIWSFPISLCSESMGQQNEYKEECKEIETQYSASSQYRDNDSRAGFGGSRRVNSSGVSNGIKNGHFARDCWKRRCGVRMRNGVWPRNSGNWTAKPIGNRTFLIGAVGYGHW